jgi:hypothetical protein
VVMEEGEEERFIGIGGCRSGSLIRDDKRERRGGRSREN